MVETMNREGFKALIHTAAASNLGQMLQKICLNDGVALVNIVRKPEQTELLRSVGATYVCDSSQDTFIADLTAAIAETGAYLAFDATGGGELANQILIAMEAAANQTATEYSRYGSTQKSKTGLHLRGLERRPTHTYPQLRYAVERWRMAVNTVPAEGRTGASRRTASTCCRRDKDDLCQRLYRGNFPRPGAAG